MNPLSAAELGVLDWIAAHFHCAVLDTLMPAITSLGNAGMVWILLAVVLLFVSKGHKDTGFQVALALIFSLIFCNLILKNAVDRIRPCDLNAAVELLIPRPHDPSFPSGHTSASFAAAMVLVLTRCPGRWVALGLAVVIAFSRLYLYVHFPTDVLGGMVIGTLCAVLAVVLWRKWVAASRFGRFLTRHRGKQTP